MPYELEETGELSRMAHVTVPVSEYQKHFNKALRQLSKRVKISGFRKGKIPMSVMRQRYGNQVMQDVIETLLRTHVDEVLEDGGRIIHMEQPEVTQLPNDKQPMTFNLEYEIRPEIDPIGYMGLEVGKPTVEIENDAVDARIEELREEYATLQPIALRTEIREGDIVELDFHALGDDPALEQLQGEGVQIEVGAGQSLPGIEEALEGAEFNAMITTTVQLGDEFPVDELKDRDVELQLNIKSVKKRVLPTVDDEFAVDTGVGDTLIELRSNIRKELAEERGQDARHIAEDNLVDKLLEQNDFPLPEKFLTQQVDQTIQQQFQQMMGQQIDLNMLRGSEAFDEMRETLRPDVARKLRSEFLLLSIAEKEDYQVTDEDLKEYCAHQAQYMGTDADTFERWLRSDQNRLQQAAASALLEKTLTQLLGEATIVETEWPEEDEEVGLEPEAPAEELGELVEEVVTSQLAEEEE